MWLQNCYGSARDVPNTHIFVDLPAMIPRLPASPIPRYEDYSHE
jgi:hypothetical protein